MLHKTSSRIKQFISHKRNKGIKEDDELFQNGDRPSRRFRPKSWTSQGRKATDEGIMRRTNSSAAIQDPLSPLPDPDYMRPSFINSSCKGDCSSMMSRPYPLSIHQPPLPRKRRPSLEIRSNSVTTFAMQAMSVHDLYRTTPASQIDLLEALALEPDDSHDKTQDQECLNLRKPRTDDGSRDIQQFIQETNLAIKAVGSALTKAMTASQERSLDQDNSTVTISRTSSGIDLCEQHLVPLGSHVSLTKSKHKMPQTHRCDCFNCSAHNRIKTPKLLPISSSGRKMTEPMDGMSNTFSDTAFDQVPVGGITDTGRIRQGELDITEEKELKCSSETTRSSQSRSTTQTITPIGSFHLDDLPSRLNAADLGYVDHRGKASQLVATIDDCRTFSGSSTKRTLSHTDLQIHDATGIPRRYGNDVRSLTDPVELERPYVAKGLSRRHLMPFVDKRPSLESTLVKQASTPSSCTPTETKAKNKVNPAVERDTVLKSTPYSLTSHGFRHGDIRLNQHPRAARKPKMRNSNTPTSHAEGIVKPVGDIEGEDGCLDWTAFQMAISGVADDHWMDPDEDINLIERSHSKMEDLESEIDEILKWWFETGLEAGTVIQKEKTVKKRLPRAIRHRRRQVNLRRFVEYSLTVDEPAPSETIYALNTDPPEISEHGGNNPSKLPMETGEGAESKRGNDGKGEPVDNDAVSLPPSPSAWARVSFIPMGSNIDHDLRDFLKWKSECVDSCLVGENFTLR
jgi:hypothetical protein